MNIVATPNKNKLSQKKAIQISKPIIYGTISFYQGIDIFHSLGKKAEEKHTHQWCAYVRGPNNEDLSTFISKVEFILHPSFEPPQIAVTSPPFEIVQTGWGEFDIFLLIHFKEEFQTPLEIRMSAYEPHGKSVTLIKISELYHTHTSSSQSVKKPVISEFYEELVFINPSEKFQQLLNESKTIEQQPNTQGQVSQVVDENQMNQENEEPQNDFHNYFTKFDPSEHKQKLEDALKIVKMEVEKLTSQLSNIDKETLQLQKEINQFH